jgi:hypothetical protein
LGKYRVEGGEGWGREGGKVERLGIVGDNGSAMVGGSRSEIEMEERVEEEGGVRVGRELEGKGG